MKYKTIKTKAKKEVETFEYKGKKIEVLQYLPTEKKYELICQAIAQSIKTYGIDPFCLDMYFELYVIQYYTNIDIDFEDETTKPSDIFDDLKMNNIIDETIRNINEVEWGSLYNALSEQVKTMKDYCNSFGSAVDKVVDLITSNLSALNAAVPEYIGQHLKDDKQETEE